MTGRNGQELLSTWVAADLATAFKDRARQIDGGAAASLRRLIGQSMAHEAMGGGEHGTSVPQAAVMPRGIGQGTQIGFRLRSTERAALDKAARSFGTSPANWVRSLVLVHLTRHPEWNPAERDALHALSGELRGIKNSVMQIAQVLEDAMRTGACPAGEGVAAREAAEIVRNEMRRMTAVITGNYDYWGLPDAERLTAAPGAVKRATAALKTAEAQRKSRPKRRPARFTDAG